MNIHPTAIVAPEAELEEGVEIGPYSIIGPDVKIGKNTIIGPHTVIDRYTQIGEGCHILQFCSLGAPPQDIKFAGEKTGLIIGNFNMIREYVSIHRGTTADQGLTIIGDRNMIMAYCHIAHNCILENNVIMANASTLAGHVHLEDFAFVSGLSGIILPPSPTSRPFATALSNASVAQLSGMSENVGLVLTAAAPAAGNRPNAKTSVNRIDKNFLAIVILLNILFTAAGREQPFHHIIVRVATFEFLSAVFFDHLIDLIPEVI